MHQKPLPGGATLARAEEGGGEARLGGGMSIAGLTGRAEIMDSVHAGGLGTTYGGNPIACAAALAVPDAFEEDGLLEKANRVGGRITSVMRDIQRKHPGLIGEVRGLGPMAAMEIVQDAESKTPDKERTGGIVRSALQEGLILLTAGQHGNEIRILVPLFIKDEQLEEGLAILSRAVDEAASYNDDRNN